MEFLLLLPLLLLFFSRHQTYLTSPYAWVEKVEAHQEFVMHGTCVSVLESKKYIPRYMYVHTKKLTKIILSTRPMSERT